MKIVAIVPMRHLSERVEGKNYRPFAGKPLYHHIVSTLLGCREIAEVVIDTDSLKIKDETAKIFPRVRVLKRPEHLAGGSVSMNEVLWNTTAHVSADYYLQTHSTNPLLGPETVSRAIQMFLDNLDTHDSLFSVRRMQTRLWSESGEPINHEAADLIRTQDLTPVYEENSCIYIFSRSSLEKGGNRIGEKPFLFEMDPIESWDIDDEADFRIAELIYMHRDRLGLGAP